MHSRTRKRETCFLILISLHFAVVNVLIHWYQDDLRFETWCPGTCLSMNVDMYSMFIWRERNMGTDFDHNINLLGILPCFALNSLAS